MNEDDIERVWNKGRPIPGKDPDIMRQDPCSTPMKKDDYGNRDSDYGWEIDHINPKGSDNVANLQPLNWKNNTRKSDGKLDCSCSDD
jgi:hypothetical protein